MTKIYRGEKLDQYRENQGRLKPNGSKLEERATSGHPATRYGVSTYGESKQNAVALHQHNSNYQDLGHISTTTSYEVAKNFALNGLGSGVVYVLDREKFSDYKVVEIKIKPLPGFEEEFEITIHHEDGGAIPHQVILGVMMVE